MSIYTDMIEIIEVRGLGHSTLINHKGQCCLLGAAALAKGYDPELIRNNDEFAETCYTSEGIEELDELCKKGVGYTYSDYENGKAIFRYNDDYLRGKQDQAIELLKKAESLRQSKNVV